MFKLTAMIALIFLGNVVNAATPTHTASLSWKAPTKNIDGTPVNLTGYVIKYSQNKNNLSTRWNVTGAKTTSVKIPNLTAGIWYFECVAIGAGDKHSANSNMVSVKY